MRIAFIVEGKTERVFIPELRNFIRHRLGGAMPRLDVRPYDGPIPRGEKLKRDVELLLHSSDAVIALTDVYTGESPPRFRDAADAKAQLRSWVGNNNKFHAHAAQFDFEAWLLPYWEKIIRLCDSNLSPPGDNPEQVNHMRPPSHRIKEAYRTGRRGQAYVKARDAARILRGEDLLVAVNACAELKTLLNTVLVICGGTPIQ